MNHITNEQFLSKYAPDIEAAQTAWQRLTGNDDLDHHESHRLAYMEALGVVKSAYVREKLFDRDLASPDCRDGLNGNFHLILEAITGIADDSPPRRGGITL